MKSDNQGLNQLNSMTYFLRTGKTIEDTILAYHGFGIFVGLAVGATAGSYVANEVMEWLTNASDGVWYAGNGITGLVSGIYIGRKIGRVGLSMGVNKVRSVLNK